MRISLSAVSALAVGYALGACQNRTPDAAAIQNGEQIAGASAGLVRKLRTFVPADATRPADPAKGD